MLGGCRTREGGAHEEGFRTALTDLVNDYARREGYLSADDGDITAAAVHEGLTAVVSVRLAHPVFEGSTRTRLRNPEADAYVRGRPRTPHGLAGPQPEGSRVHRPPHPRCLSITVICIGEELALP
ncbi:hypothetical protein PV721_10195 [Streptomyces sp. MB09-01]|uniref:hypothetical protein n=1 Tax=Streptomyces sp. MB09-01 TaxID=3028666 RepID=UPI0029ACC62B|nr:hypothetical protein [Streptomyces sp. MB09-01]MDX3534732.1 hypothetical protein [Streptomyces sp. MB09-01]